MGTHSYPVIDERQKGRNLSKTQILPSFKKLNQTDKDTETSPKIVIFVTFWPKRGFKYKSITE